MADVIYKNFGNNYDPEIAALYPVCRVFEFEGFQVAVVRETDPSGAPMLAVTFPAKFGVCTARIPFDPTADGFERRDSTYCSMIGTERITAPLVETITAVWEDQGRPSDCMKGNGHAVPVRSE